MTRRLDFEIAQEIFGWTKHANGRSTEVETAKLDWEYDWVPKRFNGNHHHNIKVPEYSSTWDAAGLVMEEMHRRTGVEKLWLEATFGATMWSANIGKMSFCSNSAPEAICQVAINWTRKNPGISKMFQ